MNYPKKILNNILWNFQEQKFFLYESFRMALISYNEKIKGESFSVNLDDAILKTNEVAIQYEYWDDKIEDSIEPDFLLVADDKFSFSIGELLFKIHNEVCENLKNDDHVFLEGLDLWEGEHPNYPGIPLYFLQQGS